MYHRHHIFIFENIHTITNDEFNSITVLIEMEIQIDDNKLVCSSSKQIEKLTISYSIESEWKWIHDEWRLNNKFFSKLPKYSGIKSCDKRWHYTIRICFQLFCLLIWSTYLINHHKMDINILLWNSLIYENISSVQ